MHPLTPLFHYCRYVALATLFSFQDLSLVVAYPLFEKLIGSGRLDVLVQQRALVAAAEVACKESV